MFASGHNVVVLDAAVLIEAGWNKDCHEVWVCTVPRSVNSAFLGRDVGDLVSNNKKVENITLYSIKKFLLHTSVMY